ncbi:MAG: ABC transporter ATP-binding protein [Myxococcota bacterium]|nr:ABC transporter ATP-binding protein [Myxococcota bacterium]
MTEPVLTAEGLVRRFSRPDGDVHTVLDGASLTLAAGEAVAIVGPSGSGKTTLVNLLAGLDRPDGGTVQVAGQALAGLDEDARATLRNQHVGLVLQQDQLLAQCTALENVLLPTLARSTREDRVSDRALSLLEAVGLGAFASHRPAQLSAGQRQRVAVARALIHQPCVVLADEPTGALDRDTSSELLARLLEVRAARDTALLVVTHDDTIVAGMDRALTLCDGRLVPAPS